VTLILGIIAIVAVMVGIVWFAFWFTKRVGRAAAQRAVARGWSYRQGDDALYRRWCLANGWARPPVGTRAEHVVRGAVDGIPFAAFLVMETGSNLWNRVVTCVPLDAPVPMVRIRTRRWLSRVPKGHDAGPLPSVDAEHEVSGDDPVFYQALVSHGLGAWLVGRPVDASYWLRDAESWSFLSTWSDVHGFDDVFDLIPPRVRELAQLAAIVDSARS